MEIMRSKKYAGIEFYSSFRENEKCENQTQFLMENFTKRSYNFFSTNFEKKFSFHVMRFCDSLSRSFAVKS